MKMKPFSPNVFTELRQHYGINYKADEKREADSKDKKLIKLINANRSYKGWNTRRKNNQKP